MTTAGGGTARVETVTVLVTDLVESTLQRVRLGEEESDRLRARHDRLTTAAITRHGGRIVKHTGDGLMAAFSGASEALAAAVAVQQAIWSDNNTRAEHLRVRIGISAGDVTIEGDDCFGLPVVEAQRLEMAAESGQILCSALVRALAHGRGGVTLRPIGALELKGLEAPLEAEEVLWSPPASPGPGLLPPLLADRGTFPFAGRGEELEVVRRVWHAVMAGETRIVLISGEPGIGKTRVAAEVARGAAFDGGFVLGGRCDELVTSPYQPFAEALEWWSAQPTALHVLGDSPAELLRLAPRLRSMVPDLPPPLEANSDAERLLLFDAVRSWLAQLTAIQPVVLVADDVHWADMGTVLLLRHVVASDPVPRLLVVATYRDTDLDRSRPLSSVLGELRRRSDMTRVSLGGLGPDEVAELVALAAEQDLDERSRRLAVALHEETGGNPFFVGEVLRHLSETGAGDGDLWAPPSRSRTVLPEGVREVVGRRLSLLPEATQQALRTAAVIGTSFTLDLLARVTAEAEDGVLDALEPAVSAHLLVERDVASFEFAHAIVRSTLHAELTTTRRARLHEAVAIALEQLHEAQPDGVVADLAYHWAEAGPGGDHGRAVTYAKLAAEAAFANTAPEEAARWYRRARELLDGADAALDAKLLYRLGEAEAYGFEPGWQDTLLAAARAAEEIGDYALMSEALCINRRSVFTSFSPLGADLEKIDLLERALPHARDDDILRARLSAALAVELLYIGDVDRRLALVEENWQIADSLDDPVEWARTRLLVAGAASMKLQSRLWYEQRIAQFERVLEVARDRGDREIEFWTLRDLFYTGMFVGVPNRHQALADAGELVSSYRHPFLEDDLLVMRMGAAFIDGDIDRGEDLGALIARQFGAHNRSEGTIHVGSARLQAARERAGFAALLDRLPRVPDTEGPQAVPGFSTALRALVFNDAGRVDEAYRMVEEFSGNGFADVPNDAARPVALSLWAEVVAKVGHLRAAAALHDLLEPDEGLHYASGGWYLGAVTRYTALLSAALGRGDDAEGGLLEAEAAHQQMHSPTWLARTLLDHGDLLAARGDIRGAGERAEAALAAIGDHPLEMSRQRAATMLERGRTESAGR